MSHPTHVSPTIRRLSAILASALLPVLGLTGVDLLADGTVNSGDLGARYLFFAGILIFAEWFGLKAVLVRLRVLWLAGALTLGLIVAYLIHPATSTAWGLAAFFYALLLLLQRATQQDERRWLRWICTGWLTVSAALPVLLVEIESGFAEEELFGLGQALVLAISWLLLVLGDRRWVQPLPAHRPAERQRLTVLTAILAPLLLLVLSRWGIQRFQRSFFPAAAPSYTGISTETPFLCGESETAETVFDGEEVFAQLLQQIDDSPHKGPPELGMLALAHQDYERAQVFRAALLSEVAARRFTQAANSLKSIQYDAVLRLYYYDQARTAFPHLFSQAQQAEVAAWFANINRRAMTVEWIDWLYALAFGDWPQGPYLNQATGAGLIALLEVTDLAAPELRTRNQAFLAAQRKGWDTRFRNTDDAIVYQPIWLNNVGFQSRYTQQTNLDNQRRSFEWLLLQSLPDGAVLQYNFPLPVALSGAYYLGAILLDDPRYVWLAGRSLAHPSTQTAYLLAQPGVLKPRPGSAQSPGVGSCLIYADSGLPNQPGPLAPDKIVFRSGWETDDAYLMLNLRFSGYHRYRATNTVTLLYAGRPIVVEETEPKRLWWLPEGRQLLRDKRIPRENLNGLLVAAMGARRVLTTLTGLGSLWAQDPPHYAQVVDFQTGVDFDQSHTRLQNWHGWQHDRVITFLHDGPLVVVDRARGSSAAAVVWHLSGPGHLDGNRYIEDGGQAELVLLGQNESTITLESAMVDSLYYKTQPGGDVVLVSVFLTGDWVGAQVQRTQNNLIITATDGRTVRVDLLPTG